MKRLLVIYVLATIALLGISNIASALTKDECLANAAKECESIEPAACLASLDLKLNEDTLVMSLCGTGKGESCEYTDAKCELCKKDFYNKTGQAYAGCIQACIGKKSSPCLVSITPEPSEPEDVPVETGCPEDSYIHEITLTDNYSTNGKNLVNALQFSTGGDFYIGDNNYSKIPHIPKLKDGKYVMAPAKAICIVAQYTIDTDAQINVDTKDNALQGTIQINVNQEIIDAAIHIVIDLLGDKGQKSIFITNKPENFLNEDGTYKCGITFSGANIEVSGMVVEGFPGDGICTLEGMVDFEISESGANKNGGNGGVFNGDGIKVNNFTASGNTLSGVVINATNFTMTNSKINYNNKIGIEIKEKASEVTIEDTEATNNNHSDLYVDAAATKITVSNSTIVNSTDKSNGQLTFTNRAAQCSTGYDLSDDSKYCILRCADGQFDHNGTCVDACSDGTLADDYRICRSTKALANPDTGADVPEIGNSASGGCGCAMAPSKAPITDTLVLIGLAMIPLGFAIRKRLSYSK